jgi:hypothetical protein
VRISIHIERVTLDGVPVARHQTAAVRQAMEAELHRLVTAAPQGALPSSGVAVPVLRAPMRAAGAGDADGWGEGIAGAVRAVMLP